MKNLNNNGIGRVLRRVVWGLIAVVVMFAALYVVQKYVLHHNSRWFALQSPVFYPKGDVRGIDVSHFQKMIDWDEVAEDKLNGVPIRFVFIKATEGKNVNDEYFNRNFSEARKHGILRGAYHLFTSTSSAQEQALHYCNVVGLRDNDLVPVLDVEQLGRSTPRELQEGVLDWMNIVENHYGVTPILYTSFKFKNTYLSGEEFKKYPYWIAHYYIEDLAYQGEWILWQHTDIGHVNGIDEYVDINVFNGDYTDLLQFTMRNARKQKNTDK